MKQLVKKILSFLHYSGKCYMDFGAVVLGDCEFEGYNKISKGAYVKDVNMGYGSYVGASSYIIGATIGRFSSIGDRVKIVNATHPLEPFVSTHPAFYSKDRIGTFVKENKYNEYIGLENCSVEVGNDVWIGSNVLIKGGVTIGDGSIIAMGAVVTKDVPPYSIVGGVPGKLIRYRFTDEQRDKLTIIKWWDKDINWINEHANLFSDIDAFLETFSK